MYESLGNAGEPQPPEKNLERRQILDGISYVVNGLNLKAVKDLEQDPYFVLSGEFNTKDKQIRGTIEEVSPHVATLITTSRAFCHKLYEHVKNGGAAFEPVPIEPIDGIEPEGEELRFRLSNPAVEIETILGEFEEGQENLAIKKAYVTIPAERGPISLGYSFRRTLVPAHVVLPEGFSEAWAQDWNTFSVTQRIGKENQTCLEIEKCTTGTDSNPEYEIKLGNIILVWQNSVRLAKRYEAGITRLQQINQSIQQSLSQIPE